MLTPPWAKCGSSGGGKMVAKTGPGAAVEPAGGYEDDDRRQSVARRLDAAPSFSSLEAVDAAGMEAGPVAAGAVQQQQQQQDGSRLQAPSFDFGVVLGSPPKKSKVRQVA